MLDPQPPTLTGKVALITGAARRIGASIARTLHGQSMSVVIHYNRSRAEARSLCDELNRHRKQSAICVHADLLDSDAPARLVADAVSFHGRLDAVVNNASSFYPTPIERATASQWNDLMGTNLAAPFYVSQSAAPHLQAACGSIVNIADIHGQRPLAAHPLYSTAKAGLLMLTRALALELAPRVRVNAVSPGTILWPEGDSDEAARVRLLERTPLARRGEPGEVARAVLYLIRDATFTTGEVISVDGGRSLSE